MSIITGDQDTAAFLMVHTGDCAVHGHHQFKAFQWGWWELRHAIERPHLHPTEKTQMKASQALGFLQGCPLSQDAGPLIRHWWISHGLMFPTCTDINGKKSRFPV